MNQATTSHGRTEPWKMRSDIKNPAASLFEKQISRGAVYIKTVEGFTQCEQFRS